MTESPDPMDHAAKLRRHEGRLLVIVFDGPKPKECAGEGTRILITRNGQEISGTVLPNGSHNRMVLRMDADLHGWSGEDEISIRYHGTGRVISPTPPAPLPDPQVIDTLPEPRYDFSIFTFKTSDQNYTRMLQSYADYGFNAENTQFFALDHRKANLMDGYGLSRFAQTRGDSRYIIMRHDDIALMQDTHQTQIERLDALEAHDPSWMIAGVAGGLPDGAVGEGNRKTASRTSDRWGPGRRVRGPFPRKVESLDECFLLMPRQRMPQSSIGLVGYHFFGTDLCLQAELAGGSAYVIDFHFYHYGHAKRGPEYFAQRDALEKRYARIFPGRVLGNTTTRLQF